MVGNAIAQSAQPILSYNFGLANGVRVRAAARIALMTAVGCGAVVSALFVFVPEGWSDCSCPVRTVPRSWPLPDSRSSRPASSPLWSI